MFRSLFAVCGVFACSAAITASANAQEYSPGHYDGRSVPGWAFDRGRMGSDQLPTWRPVKAADNGDLRNCNVQVAPGSMSREEFDGFLSEVTPAMFSSILQQNGLQATVTQAGAHTISGRLSYRAVYSFDFEGLALGGVTYIVPGLEEVMTLTCGGFAEDIEANEPVFDGFVEALDIQITPLD